MFTLVGVGLGDASDITMKGMNAVKEADVVFLEAYTSFLINSNAEELTGIYGKPVILADREMVESGAVLNDANVKKVVLLVVGDVFGATTHSDLIVRCNQQGIESKVVHNASIINAVGCCGLQLYRFGQVISLCFWTETWRPDSWYERLQSNRASGIHTLVLLDIKVKEISDENLARGRKIYEPPRYMTIRQAVEQILEVEGYKQGGAVAADGSTFAVGLARVGSASQQVVAGTMKDLLSVDFGSPLHSLVIAGDVHDCEQEHVDLFRKAGQ
ncbi:diphthine synthase-like protein [Leishmania tarentolae]|uniref:diphthine methyl ester synthase n=1 Tax=Leishmania tarentolae TaxID=5689 RepID=A0A640KN52_LEITA|nr:diphthine synthase-like protein [Leishmania tarentolae]